MTISIRVGNALALLRAMPADSVHCCITSPPYYGLRDYGLELQVWPDGWRGSLGLEPTPALYIEHMVAVFREAKRVLRKDGTLWLNIGDSYNNVGGGNSFNAPVGSNSGTQRAAHKGVQSAKKWVPGLKPKDLLGIPWMLAFALRDDGWWLRSEITWAKKAPMPESCRDRPTTATEKVFLLTRSARYFYDAEAVKEEASENSPGRGVPSDNRKQGKCGNGHSGLMVGIPGKRNMRNFWLLGPEPFPEAHFATFITEIPRRAILAGTSERGVCPKCGAGWGRQTSVDYRKNRPSAGNDPRSRAEDRQAQIHGGGGWRGNNLLRDTETIGWHPTCSCDAGAAVPATCLDPFLGAGTTALVADRLGRHCIGIELNPAYAAMARRRIAAPPKAAKAHLGRSRPASQQIGLTRSIA